MNIDVMANVKQAKGQTMKRVFLEVDTTYLELNSQITDTIVCKFYRSEDNFIITNVWYNGNLKWDDYATRREFTIMK